MNFLRIARSIALVCLIGLVSVVATGLVPVRASAFQPHSPILIDGNSAFTSENGVTRGSGTAGDPYNIEGWDISLDPCDPGSCGNKGAIEIHNTNAAFIIRNVNVHADYIYGRGILLVNATDGLIQDATFSKSQVGILIAQSVNITISDVTLHGNGFVEAVGGGIRIVDSLNIRVDASNVSGNNYVGISAIRTRGLVIDDNTVSHNSGRYENGFGMAFYEITDARITGNNITNNPGHLNGSGIELDSSNDTIISDNTISNRPGNGFGVRLFSPERITIVHFNFIDYRVQAFVENGDNNSWDNGYPSGGNYWSDLGAIDNCSGPSQDECSAPDGIADQPYSIALAGAATGIDRYPLMKPFAPLETGSVRFAPTSITSQNSNKDLTAS